MSGVAYKIHSLSVVFFCLYQITKVYKLKKNILFVMRKNSNKQQYKKLQRPNEYDREREGETARSE